MSFAAAPASCAATHWAAPPAAAPTSRGVRSHVPALGALHPRCRARGAAVRVAASSDGAAPAQKLADTPTVALSPGMAPLLPSAAGVYAVYNSASELQYIGMSRKLSASLGVHMQDLPDQCASARLLAVAGATASKDALQTVWRSWVEEAVATHGRVPVGNTPDCKDWTQRKPKAGKSEIKLTSGKGLADLTVPLSTLIDAVVKQNKVVAFIKGTRAAPECGFSKRLVLNLDETGVDYEVVNVLDAVYNPGLREEIKTYSQWPTIPQLYAHGEFLGGADIVGDLHDKGQLKASLQAKA